MKHRHAMIISLAVALVASAPALAEEPCVGNAGIVCEAVTHTTELTADAIALPTVTAPAAPGWTVSIELKGPAAFLDAPATVTGASQISAEGAWRVYGSTGDQVVAAGLTVQLTPEAYMGDQVLARVRVADPNGATTVVHDATFRAIEIVGFSRVHVPTFNPAANPNQVSVLRLTNPTDVDGAVLIRGVDDAGDESGAAQVLIPARGSVHLTAAELEAGSGGMVGALGAGSGKWRLTVDADFHGLVAQAFARAPDGSLSNMSAVVEQ